MANVQRYRRNDQKVVKGKIQAGVKVEIGDLVALVSGYVVNAVNSGVTTVTNFKAIFYGVLIEGATAGTETADTDCIVGVSGTYEFDLAAALGAALPVGKTIGAVAVSSVIQDQLVASVADRTTAIALLAQNALVGDTTLFIDIFPALAGYNLA